MRINNISKISFQRGIDNHIHRGYWWSEVSDEQAASIKGGIIKANKKGEKFVFRNANEDMLTLINKSISKPEDKIDKIITSNLDCMVRNHPDAAQSTNFENGIPFLKDEIEGNLELLKSSINKNEFLYLTGQPGFGDAKNLEKVLEQASDKFVGVKLHPAQLGIKADDLVYEPYMQFAQKHKLPVLFHSEVKVNWNGSIGTLSNELATSDPEYIYNLAKKFPDVPVIMGHTGAGGAPAHDKAIEIFTKAIKNKDANLYCDISWMDFTPDGLPNDNIPSIVKLIKTCKEEDQMGRILFGSDVPVGIFGIDKAERFNTTPSDAYSDMVTKLKTAIKNNFGDKADDVIDKIFYKNADDLFFKKTWVQEAIETVEPEQIINEVKENTEEIIKPAKNNSAIKAGLAIGAGVLAFMGIAYYVLQGKKTNNQSAPNPVNQPAPTPTPTTTNIIRDTSMPSVFQKFTT